MELLGNKFNLIIISHHLTVLIFIYVMYSFFTLLWLLSGGVKVAKLASTSVFLKASKSASFLLVLRFSFVPLFFSPYSVQEWELNQLRGDTFSTRRIILIEPIPKPSKSLCELINCDHKASQTMKMKTRERHRDRDVVVSKHPQIRTTIDDNNDLYTIHVLTLAHFIYRVIELNAWNVNNKKFSVNIRIYWYRGQTTKTMLTILSMQTQYQENMIPTTNFQ